MKNRFSMMLILAIALSIGAASAQEVVGVIPEVAYEDLKNDNTYLVDVRTPCEYNWIGHPAVNLADDPMSEFLEGKVLNIPYLLWQYDRTTGAYAMSVNPRFVREMVRAIPRNATIYFICRSGGRSAFAQEYLWDPANTTRWQARKIDTWTMFNVDEGFEGGRDPVTGHRTQIDIGWKNSSLPYKDGSAGIWTPPTCHDDSEDDD